VGVDYFATGGGNPPPVAGEYRRADFATQPQMPIEPQVFDQVAVVLLYLLTGRPKMLPVGFGCERELVSVGRNIASQTGIAVPVPHTTNIRALFQDGQVGEACFLQSVGDGNTGHTRAHDHDVRIALLVWSGHVDAPSVLITV